MTFPKHYQLPSFTPYSKGGQRELNDKVTTADFRAIANSLHAEFFAEHPDTETFTGIVKLLLAKIYDERQRRSGEQYVFQVLQLAGKEESAASLASRIAPLYESAYLAYIDPDTSDSLDDKSFGPERVKSVVKGLQGVAITRGAALNGDVIGAFFEEILRSGFKQDKGMYFTHANLVWFILEALDLNGLTKETWTRATHPNDRLPYVIDPSCGSGTFLLRAMQMMTSAIRDDRDSLVQTQDDVRYFNSHLSDSNPNEWAKDFIYGSDPKFVMAITAKVNMVLHGDGSAHVLKWDSLRKLDSASDRRLQPLPDGSRSVPVSRYAHAVSEQFDVVVSNPPFGITIAPDTKKSLSEAFSLGQATPSESLFIERYAQLLKPKGRLGVVVPESLLNAADYRGTRELLFRMFHVRGVVSLPRNLFVETPTLTSLLFAQKKSREEIASWDADWLAASTLVDTAIAKARNSIRAALKDDASSLESVERAFLAGLNGHIDRSAFIRTRGKRPKVLSASLPNTIDDVPGAVAYFNSFLKSSGFSALREQAIMRQMAKTQDYTWSSFAVDEVGFKLSKRGERQRPNQLQVFIDESGIEQPNLQLSTGRVASIVDVENPKRVLDFIRRDVKWA